MQRVGLHNGVAGLRGNPRGRGVAWRLLEAGMARALRALDHRPTDRGRTERELHLQRPLLPARLAGRRICWGVLAALVTVACGSAGVTVDDAAPGAASVGGGDNASGTVGLDPNCPDGVETAAPPSVPSAPPPPPPPGALTCDAHRADVNHDPSDGCEVDLWTDAANCGAAGNACANVAHASGACVEGVCACAPPFINADGDLKNGCEASLEGASVPHGSISSAVIVGSKVIVGGAFDVIGPNVGQFASLSPTDGTPSPATCKFSGTVRAIAPDGQGGSYVGGSFGAVTCGSETFERDSIAHLFANGTLDPNFAPELDPVYGATVYAILRAGNVVYVGGAFDQVDDVLQQNLAAFDAQTGARIAAWMPQPTGVVYALATNGPHFYVGGSFSAIGNPTRTASNLARVDLADGQTPGVGAVDANWGPDAGGSSIRAIALAEDAIYVGGFFSTFQNVTRNRVARFSLADGTRAPDSFDPNVNNAVYSLYYDKSRGLYAGGTFSTVNGGTTRTRLARFITSGPDEGALRGDDLYVGGEFLTVNGGAHGHLAKFSVKDAALVDSFTVATDANVHALAVRDKRLFAGGEFTSFGGSPRNRAASLDCETLAVDAWDPTSRTTRSRSSSRRRAHVRGDGLGPVRAVPRPRRRRDRRARRDLDGPRPTEPRSLRAPRAEGAPRRRR